MLFMRLFGRAPIWVRISVLTILVLAGVLVGTMVLGAAGIGETNRSGGSHGTGQRMEMDADGSGDGHTSADDHDSPGPGATMDHGSAGDQPSSRHDADHARGGE